MGIVVNEELARTSSCTCHQIDSAEEPKGRLCFISGIVGALSHEQDTEFCEKRLIITEDRIKARIQRFRRASKICKVETAKYPKGERIIPRIRCMKKELAKK